MDLFSVFEEWNIYAKQQKLHPRDIDFSSIIRNSKIKIPAITGIRRSGKTSLLMLLTQQLANRKENVAYINMEDNRLKNQGNVFENIIKWFGDEGYLLLDEITSIQGWEGWLARTHELLKGKVHIIVSSSRKSLSQPSKPLRGRIVSYELYPLSFREYLDFQNIKIQPTTAGIGKRQKAFKKFQKYGGFPEVALTENNTDKIRILNAYFNDIIALDVAEMSHMDISVVETFARYVLQSPYFSASKCLNFFKSMGFKIGKEKLLNLEKYMQSAYLFFFIPIFSYSIKDRAQYPRKSYVGDTGFFYGIQGLEDKGRVFENIVFLELKRQLTGQQEICYWKNKEGMETDFVVRQGSNIKKVIQVSSKLDQEDTLKREISGMVACAKELDVDDGLIITENDEKTEIVDGIKVIFKPFMKWLKQKE
ncbi:MAG: ATP-binding protein [Candidatus Thermoplasmatota archaeon]